ncbi:MAG: hypothetical protein LUC35_04930 [Clostridiales bacterium]|nr:hypothetical protein [Clostridiales bacterium]
MGTVKNVVSRDIHLPELRVVGWKAPRRCFKEVPPELQFHYSYYNTAVNGSSRGGGISAFPPLYRKIYKLAILFIAFPCYNDFVLRLERAG